MRANRRVLLSIGRPLARYLSHPSLACSATWPLGEIVAALSPAQSPPVLLISLPRSGSTWVGRILGSSEGSLYLDEPLTRTYRRLTGNGASFFEYEACREKAAYDRVARLAFRGIPRFPDRSLPYPEQWSPLRRSSKRVLIKEVNPLMLPTWIARFRPRVVYLVRHPVAVARSVQALAWTGEQFRGRFAESTLAELEKRFQIPHDGGFWEQSGALQAVAQNVAMEALSEHGDHLSVRYEDLCRDPLAGFSRILEFCDLPLSPGTRREIDASTRSDAEYRAGGYETVRDSRAMIEKWRGDVARERIDALKASYLANRPRFYGAEADW